MERKSAENQCPIKLIIFDLDDTLIYGENDESIGPDLRKFTPVGDYDEKKGPNRVVDSPGKVQVLVDGAREVIPQLSKIATLTWASMGPEWQMRGFMDAFGLSQYFDWELGSYDRRDKGEKVELCIEHYNSRLAKFYAFSDPRITSERISNENVLFVDDNLGYLARVDSYLPGIKVLWAHYRGENGMLDFYLDLQEQYNIDLRKYLS